MEYLKNKSSGGKCDTTKEIDNFSLRHNFIKKKRMKIN